MALLQRLRARTRRIRDAAKALGFRLAGKRFARITLPDPILARTLAGCRARSDISDHLGEIYHAALDSPPGLIVELGTRGGESTRALLAAAAATERHVLSIDTEPCDPAELPHRERWHFVQADDVAFGRDHFAEWCETKDLPTGISTLFVDTSHEYEHTRREIAAWFPHLSPGAHAVFHDTHMADGTYGRLDGSIGHGWDNRRGVIRALEEYLGRSYDESSRFVDLADGHLVRHLPNCNGLTVVRKRSETGKGSDRDPNQ